MKNYFSRQVDELVVWGDCVGCDFDCLAKLVKKTYVLCKLVRK